MVTGRRSWRVRVGIETDHGPWVMALVAAGYAVFAVKSAAGSAVPGPACGLGGEERHR